MKSLLKITTAVALGFVSQFANACPSNLEQNQIKATPSLTLCQVYDRYHAAMAKLHASGVKNPNRIGNLMAPRFINLPDWTNGKTASPDAALTLYKPAPTTWTTWEQGATIVDRQARQNFRSQRILPIDLNWIMSLHKSALEGLMVNAGNFRDGNNIGAALRAPHALTEAQTKGVASVDFTRANGQRLVTFSPVQCLEARDQAFQAHFLANVRAKKPFERSEWPTIPVNQYFKAGDGTNRQCGFLTYTPVQEIQGQLDQLISFVNSSYSSWYTMRFENNPLRVAARAQRWFIAIHPFKDGNGRLSRYVMDLLLESLGLPAPVLKDMEDDMYTTEAEWTLEIGRGLQRAVETAEMCLAKPSTTGCAEIGGGQP